MQIKKFEIRSGFSTLLIIAAVAVVGVAAVLAFGVLDLVKIKKPELPQKTLVEVDEQVKDLNILSISDELPDIEKDLSATNLEDLDNEIDQVEKDLDEI